MHIRPFNAWRPRPELASQVAAVPYDVVDTTEAMALAAGNPYSFLHVSRAEIDLPAGADPHADATYARAGANLRAFQRQGVLSREPSPVLYVYRLVMDGRAQSGIVAACAVDDYLDGTIRTHEKTRHDKEDDRTRHITFLNAQTEPIFIVFRDDPAVERIMAATMAGASLYDFIAPDGIRHTMWRIADAAVVTGIFGGIPAAYIADGHHRAAAAARVAKARRASGAAAGDFDWFMAVLFPASQVRILPYNRCVRDLRGMTPAGFLARLGETFHLTENADAAPPAPGQVSMYMGGRWYGIRWPVDARGGSAALDVTILQDRILAPLLGISDPRTDERIEFIGGIRGSAELVKRVNSGRAAVAFAMYPTQVDQMMTIADAGGIMPPKSTWFEPKLRSGLFVNCLE